MDIPFFFEDGHGNITNEQRIEAMDLQDYIDPYNIVAHQYEQVSVSERTCFPA